MKHPVLFLATFMVLTMVGCSGDHDSAQVMLARTASQQAAIANAKSYIGNFHQNKASNLRCEADDDIEEGNLYGDGDADCQFVDVKTQKKVKLECVTTLGKGCKKH
ncbi:MAG: hypothetical protein BWK73_46545 [Thiothrix lacustris]|uniref:Lipoprotein n=1 Tax=Thiothrix lacustris TaxID=525917 RepID=A0A1Y1QAB1_9GAMM|nr:MAG: hypothetical protein BWK73_46545 [Thiothrix lacustris]